MIESADVSSPEPFRRVRLGTILALLLLFTIVPLGLFAGRLVYTLLATAAGHGQRPERRTGAGGLGGRGSDRPELDHRLSRPSPPSGRSSPTTCGRSTTSRLACCRCELGWEAVRLVGLDSRVVVNTALPFGVESKLVNDDWVARGTRHEAPGSLGGATRSGDEDSTSSPSAFR